MQIFDPISGLNSPQAEAVLHQGTPLLVLAGAGSGKTRVLVHRMAHFVQSGIPAHALMAVTFTNKAAGEMRSRTEQLLARPIDAMWLGTFHGLCHRFLRLHWQDAGLSEHFQILDAEDQRRLVRRLLKELDIDDKAWPPAQVQNIINQAKDDGRRAADIAGQSDRFSQIIGKVYAEYEATCQRSGLVDFAELLLKTYEVLKTHPHLQDHYRSRFEHILVDEFQDTNRIQYLLLKAFARPEGNLTVVGDDDQSIYGWRGAKVENIRRFQQDYPSTRVIRLEQNYRSTATILRAANAVIGNNRNRLGKELWTSGQEGKPIQVYQAFNEQEEARFIAGQIEQWFAQGGAYRDCAILYRSNAQSRVLEEALIHRQIPYRIYGGVRFFERAEIKDALGYLRLLENRNDDTAFERVINTPTRGIGDRTLMTLRQHARAEGISLWQAAEQAADFLNGRAAAAVGRFVEMIENMWRDAQALTLPEMVKIVLDRTGLMDNYLKESHDKWQGRRENLSELWTAASEFSGDDWQDESQSALSAFLAHAALESGEQQAGEHQDAVQLMTLHSAKGLEFPWVCIAGMEESLFPHRMSMDSAEQLEEERRLAYVGITRAESSLLLTWAEKRRLWGTESYQRRSRFIEEIPATCREEVRLGGRISQPAIPLSPSGTNTGNGEQAWQLGQTVRHHKFGYGIVLNLEGEGEQARIQVNFEQVGSKWLVARYARLEKV
jgi:DNA helicase-2/ATP-dependent DNA helicase PcrA